MQTRPAHRLFSLFFAGLLTLGMLGAVDQLAQPEGSQVQMAQQAQPLSAQTAAAAATAELG